MTLDTAGRNIGDLRRKVNMAHTMDEAIAAARDAASNAGLQPEWAAIAFETVLRFQLETLDHSPDQPAVAKSLVGLSRIGISQEDFDDLAEADLSERTLRITVPSSRIPSAKSEATRALCLLIVSARLALGLDEEWVDSQLVRESLEDYARYDSSNFSAHLKKFEDDLTTLKKDGKLLFKLRRQGWEHATSTWQALSTSGLATQ